MNMGLFSPLAGLLKPKPSYELFGDLGSPHLVHPQVYTFPFKHIVIDNFLSDTQAAAMREHFTRTLSLGFGAEDSRDKFRYRTVYDVNLFWPSPSLDAPYSPFFSSSYFAMLRTLFNTPLSNDTVLMYHHHKKSVEDAYTHNDFVEGHFVDEPLPNGINPWYFQCTHGEPPADEPKSRTVARALAGVYYLNDSWEPSDGGETALFSPHNRLKLERKIEPISNRLFVFEVTPTSWHSYLKSSAPSRNSAAQWFFMSPEEMAKKSSRPPGKGQLGY